VKKKKKKKKKKRSKEGGATGNIWISRWRMRRDCFRARGTPVFPVAPG